MSDCLGCNLIEEKPVTLRTGKVVCSSCEAWRLECEARHVLALPTRADRAEYLAKVGPKRSSALTAEILAMHGGGG